MAADIRTNMLYINNHTRVVYVDIFKDFSRICSQPQIFGGKDNLAGEKFYNLLIYISLKTKGGPSDAWIFLSPRGTQIKTKCCNFFVYFGWSKIQLYIYNNFYLTT